MNDSEAKQQPKNNKTSKINRFSLNTLLRNIFFSKTKDFFNKQVKSRPQNVNEQEKTKFFKKTSSITQSVRLNFPTKFNTFLKVWNTKHILLMS